MRILTARFILSVLLLAPSTVIAQGMCPGDNNGDGQVTIDEIVAGVNSALGGCAEPTPGPTPAGECPYDFWTKSSSVPTFCRFIGRFNASCGSTALGAYASDGHAIVFILVFDSNPAPIYIGGTVSSRRLSDLLLWSVNSDLTSSHSLSGSGAQSLLGDRLSIDATDSFSVNSCLFSQYRGAYSSLVARELSTRNTLESDALGALDSLNRILSARE